MSKIADKIKDKTLVFLLNGPSVSQLEDKIHLFKDKDVCWVGFNWFYPVEENILSKIGKKFDIVSMYSFIFKGEDDKIRQSLHKGLSILHGPLNMEKNGRFINRFRDYDSQLEEYNPNISDSRYHTTSLVKAIGYFSSLFVKDIILFGCDSIAGSYKDPKQSKEDRKAECLARDAIDTNGRYEDIKRLYGIETRVWNCNKDSAITVFPKISIEKALRIPKSL